ncbi:MAG: glycosyltransferase [Flavisolibacter sp.]
MNSKQKVFVILSPGFAASESDTVCLPMQQAFVRSLSKTYADVNVIVLAFHYPFVRRSYSWFDVSVRSFNGKNKGGLPGIILRRNVDRALEQIHKDKKIVGLISFWLGECAYVGKRFAQRKKLPHYCWLMGQDAKPKNKYSTRLSVKGSDLIALSDFLQEEFERNYGVRPAKVIYPGVENMENAAVSRDIDLLGVGSLIPLKRFDVFLEAVAEIRKQIPTIKAVLVGDGPEVKKLKRMASLLEVDDAVCFEGSASHDAVMDLMRRTRILLHPSSYEGYSGVCQEALSCGDHVISFCRAMNTEVSQWHIVRTKDEMTGQAISILEDASTRFDRVEFQPMSFTAKQIMELYVR